MSDRPVSLNIPDAIEGQSAMNWITLILARNPLLSALYDYAYAVGARSTSLTIDAKESNLVAALEALPTFAPATPDAPKSVEEMADAIGTILPCPFCGSSADHRGEAAYVRCTNLSCEVMGPSDDPDGSKWNAVPRGLPAPEWTGPDWWQPWIDDCAARPDDHPDNLPPGFVAIGPWEPGNIAPGSVRGADYEWRPVMMQAWRRPLRRVQG